MHEKEMASLCRSHRQAVPILARAFFLYALLALATCRVTCNSSNALGYFYSSCDPSGRQALPSSISRLQAPASPPSTPPSNAPGASDFVNKTLSKLRKSASQGSLYGNVTAAPSSLELLNAAYLCRGDLMHQECVRCVNEATDVSQQVCMNANEVSIILNGCIIRYQEAPFFNLDTSSLVWGCSAGKANNTNSDHKEDVDKLVDTMIDKAPVSKQFFSGARVVADAGKYPIVYGVAQCWPYVDPDECRFCLSDLANLALSSSSQQQYCNGSEPLSGIRLYHPSCSLRFESFPFFQTDDSMIIPSTGAHSSLKRSIVVAAGLFSLATVVFSLPCIYMYLKLRANNLDEKPAHKAQTNVAPINQAEVFLLQQLQDASDNFEVNNKLGDGGYGSVYKGVLWDGREVALKRLHSESQQGEKEFLNEVNIITTVQHRNLVRLFGCCAEGSERILVYEYLKNKSLDKHLFDCRENRAPLTWIQRYDIITGIARGLAYLHEESRVCIVHRDIKPSNILLDEKMVPKVADFGLARLCEQSHINTKVAGTIGYLAPESLATGRVTGKTDTYSFGLVALEIISGRRCRDTHHNEGLVNLSWRVHQRRGDIHELVDPQLMGDWIEEEAIRVMWIALLCLQESELKRPPMSRVVSMLSERSYKFAPPIKPPWGIGDKARLDFARLSSISILPG